MEDKRFEHVKTDPKFRRITKGVRKVKIDKRFQSMFKDKKFKVKYSVDKRGRPINKTSSEDLRRYYELSSESGSEESEQEEVEEIIKDKKEVNENNDVSNEEQESDKYIKEVRITDNELEHKHKTDIELSIEVKNKLKNLKVDYARGEASLFNESSSDDDESEEEEDETDLDGIDHKWGELDNDAETTEEATCRLAACNMDWDRIRAVDLMVLFNSFLPPGGVVKSVTIYPSEFGKQRMKEEEIKGPTELVEYKDENDGDEETEEGSKYHMEKLRQYQLNRLKYYYAVVVFDCVNTANKVYTECDGMEYESSATKLDLRFIPDDMIFDDEPKEICDKLPELNKYKPRFFTTTALQQAKVDLTWDETDPGRIEITQKLNAGKLGDIDENELQNFVAVSSEEEEENEDEKNIQSDNDNGDDPILKYKALLQDIEQKENEKKNKEIEMEVTWGINLKENTEKLIKKKLEKDKEKTPFQKYLDKRKEKRKQKKLEKIKLQDNFDNEDSDMPSDIDLNDPYFAEEFNNPEFSKNKNKTKLKKNKEEDSEQNPELELLLMNEKGEDDKKHFSLKSIQKEESTKKRKNKKKAEEKEDKFDNFKVNVNDERFSALFTSHLYNIDPTDPHFKKTKAMETLINEKLKRRTDSDENEIENNKKLKAEHKKDAELSVLVKSVKRKTQALIKKK